MSTIRRIVKHQNIDIIHAHHSADLGLIVPALMGLSHVRLIFANYMLVPGPKDDWYHRMEYKRVECIISGAESMRQNSAEFLPIDLERIIHIPYGIDLEKFDSKKVEGVLRNKFSIDVRIPLIGIIGRLDPHKGQDQMIRAMPMILNHYPKAVLALIGDESPEFEGRYKIKLESLAKQMKVSNSVLFTGGTTDTPSHLVDLDVYVLATRRESFSLGCLEAMAMEKAVIGTDSGGTAEMLDHGDCGLLVAPDDPGSMCESVLKLLDNKSLAESLAKRGSEKVRAYFDKEKSMNTISQIYNEGLLAILT